MYYLWGTDDVTNEGVCQYRPRYRSCVGEHSEGMEHNAGVGLGEFQHFIQKQNENCSHAIVGEPFTEFCGQNERDGFGIGDFGLGRHCTKFKSLSMGRDGARLTMSMSFTTLSVCHFSWSTVLCVLLKIKRIPGNTNLMLVIIGAFCFMV